jgi:hypothetical protein
MPADGLDELPHDLGPLGLPKLRLLVAPSAARRRTRRCGRLRRRRARRLRADRGSSSGRCHRPTSATARYRALDAHDHRRARAGPRERVGADHVVVLLVDPALARDVGRREQGIEGRQIAGGEAGRRSRLLRLCAIRAVACRDGRRAELRRPVAVGDLGDELAVIAHAQDAGSVTVPILTASQVPLLEDGEDFVLAPLVATSSMRSCDSESMIS